MFIRTAKTLSGQAFTAYPHKVAYGFGKIQGGGGGRNLDVWAQWMAAHTCSKGDLTKYKCDKL